MVQFDQLLREWQIFYATLATACATLMGLLFVSLSLNLDLLNQEENADLMRIARRSFSDFLYVLMVSVVFLIPRQVPSGFALAMFILGGGRVMGLVNYFRQMRKESTGKLSFTVLLQEYSLPLIGGLGLLTVAAAILYGAYDALFALPFVLAFLIVSASRNAWFLLVHSRQASKQRQR